ncbi:MAG: hypothetical protein N4A50_10140 [Vallitalea sp.]|nr:hypothetical protein [Vallitalea sp.]
MDRLVTHNNYDTLFMIGSNLVFYCLSDDAVKLCNSGEELFKKWVGHHDHEHLDWYMSENDMSLKNKSLTLDYYDKELWERYGLS